MPRGLLAGALTPSTVGRRADKEVQQEVEKYRPRLEAYEKLCHELGERPADVAIAWLLHQPAVTSPIIGPRTLEQLVSTMRVMNLTLATETLKRLDGIFLALGSGAGGLCLVGAQGQDRLVAEGRHTRPTATRVPDHAREYRKQLPPFFVGITGRFWRSLGRRSSVRGHRTILIDVTA